MSSAEPVSHRTRSISGSRTRHGRLARICRRHDDQVRPYQVRLTPFQLLLANLEGKLPTPRGRMKPVEALDELRRMSGRDFGYDTQRWRQWFRDHRHALLSSTDVEIASDWISTRISSPQAVHRKLGARTHVADLLAQLQAGDELRSFRSPKETWKRRRGRRGYVIVRDGAVVASVVVAMN